jgi:hypothetical protein
MRVGCADAGDAIAGLDFHKGEMGKVTSEDSDIGDFHGERVGMPEGTDEIQNSLFDVLGRNPEPSHRVS